MSLQDYMIARNSGIGAMKLFAGKKTKLDVKKKVDMKATITLTFGDQAENHVGMQKVGKLAKSGFSLRTLKRGKERFEEKGFVCELIDLGEALDVDSIDELSSVEKDSAYVLVVRNGVNAFCEVDSIFDEQKALEWDKKAFMYGRVVNKHARHNLCYDEKSQEPDYENGKGRIVAYDDVPLTNLVRSGFRDFFGKKAKDLAGEGNYYYDVNKCFISAHGDSERKKVIAIRLGASMPIYYKWFCRGKSYGKVVEIMLNHGDLYMMSEKATGCDWKKRSKLTLRHAAGLPKKVLESLNK